MSTPLERLRNTLNNTGISDADKANAILQTQQTMIAGVQDFNLKKSLQTAHAIETSGPSVCCYAYPLLVNGVPTALPSIGTGSPTGSVLPDVTLAQGDTAASTVNQNTTMSFSRFCASLEKLRVSRLSYDDTRNVTKYQKQINDLKRDGLLDNDLALALTTHFTTVSSRAVPPPRPQRNAPAPASRGRGGCGGCLGVTLLVVGLAFLIGTFGHSCDKSASKSAGNSQGITSQPQQKVAVASRSLSAEDKAQEFLDKYRHDHMGEFAAMRQFAKLDENRYGNGQKMSEEQLNSLEKYAPYVFDYYNASFFGKGDSAAIANAFKVLKLKEPTTKSDKLAWQAALDANKYILNNRKDARKSNPGTLVVQSMLKLLQEDYTRTQIELLQGAKNDVVR